MAPSTALATRSTATPTTFPRFSQLPPEIRLEIWKFAVRDDRPSAHFFTANNPPNRPLFRSDANGRPPAAVVPSSYPPGTERAHYFAHMRESTIAVGLAAPRIDNSRSSSHTEAQQLITTTTNQEGRDGARDGQESRGDWWNEQSNPSIYLQDSGLWDACVDSRRAMISRFGEPNRFINNIHMFRKLGRVFIKHPDNQGLYFRQDFDVVAVTRDMDNKKLSQPLIVNFDFDTLAATNTTTEKSGEASPMDMATKESQKMTITAPADLLVIQPPQALPDEDGRPQPPCQCNLIWNEITTFIHGNRRLSSYSLMGGTCNAYNSCELKLFMDRTTSRCDGGQPIFAHIGMVFDTNSHLVRIPWPSAPSSQRPTGWHGGYFRRHLMRMLTSLTGGRGVENFWMIDYRLKYVQDDDNDTSSQQQQLGSHKEGQEQQQEEEGEDKAPYPGLPLSLHDRQTFKTRDFDLIELVPQDIAHHKYKYPTSPTMSLKAIQAMEDGNAVIPIQNGHHHHHHEMHALKALHELLVWQTHNTTDQVRGQRQPYPNVDTTKFRVLGVVVKGPPQAGWRPGRPGGRVYFDDSD